MVTVAVYWVRPATACPFPAAKVNITAPGPLQQATQGEVVHRVIVINPWSVAHCYRHASTYGSHKSVILVPALEPVANIEITTIGASSVFGRTKVNRELPSGGSSFQWPYRIVSRNARRIACRCPLWHA